MPDKVVQRNGGKQRADDAPRKEKTSASDQILAQLARDLTRSGPVDIASLILEERITNKDVAKELEKGVKHGKEKTRKQDAKRERRHSSTESELRSSKQSRKDSRKGAENDSRHSSSVAKNGDQNDSKSDRKKRKHPKEKKSRRSRSRTSSTTKDKKKKKKRKSDPSWSVPPIPPPPNLRLTIGPSTSRVREDDFPTYEFNEAAQRISDEDDDLPAGADFQTVKDEVDSLVQSTCASVPAKADEAKRSEPEPETFIGPQKPKEPEKTTREEDPKPPEPEFFPLSKDRPRKRSPTPDFILQKAEEAKKKKEADAKKKEAKAKARDAPKVPAKPTTLLPRNINIQLKTKQLPKPKEEEAKKDDKKDEKKSPSKRDRKSHKKSSHKSKEKGTSTSKDKEKRSEKGKDKDSSWRKRSEKDLEKLGEDAKRVLMSDGEVSSSDTYASDDEFKLRKESKLTATDIEKDRKSRWDKDRNGRDSPKLARRSSADRHRRRSSSRRRSASPRSDDERRRLIPGPWRRHLRGILDISKGDKDHDERRPPPRRRSPSPRRPRRRTPPRRFDKADYVDAHGNIDKKKLLEIAIANASKLGMEGKLPKGYEVISTIQNQSVQQLVDLCTRLQEETDKMERVSSDEDERYERWKNKHERKKREETGEEDEFSTRPIRAAKEIKFSLNLPDKKTLRQAFPVSSGTKHKDNSQWVPVEKEKPAAVVCPLTNALSKLKPNMPIPYKTLPQKPAPLDPSPMSLASTFANPTFMPPPPAPPTLSSVKEGSTRLPLTEALGSLSASATSFLAPVAGHPPVPPPPTPPTEAPIMAPPPLPPPPKPPVIRASFGRPSSVAAKAQQALAALPPPPAPPKSETAGPNPAATSTVKLSPTPPSTSNGGAVGPQLPWGAGGHEPVYPVKFPKPNPPLVLGNPVGAMSGLFQALPPTNITELVSQRAQFNERIRRQPNDFEAHRKLKEIDEKMSAWAENRNIPGIFQGAPAAPTAPSTKTEAAPNQPAPPMQRFTPWATKDQLINAPQVSGGNGMRLLQKMGWRPGRGLGKQEDGQLEPLLLDVKADRRGIQSMEERRRSDLGLDVNGKNPISLLMEHCTRMQWEQPMFECEELGPPHNRQFLWRALLNGVEYEPACPSSNKKTGKAQVCMVALSALGALSHT